MTLVAVSLFSAAGLLWAQTPTAAPTTSDVSVSGWVAPLQRDGSLALKAGAAPATPATAIEDANSTEPTGRFQLLDALQLKPAPQASAKPGEHTAFALFGHESELAT